MLFPFKKLTFTFIVNSCFFLLLIIGIQNSSRKSKVNLLIDESVSLPVGFIIGLNNIYLSTNNGRLFIIDIATGKRVSILKIDNDKISRPFVLNQNLYIIKENSVIRLN